MTALDVFIWGRAEELGEGEGSGLRLGIGDDAPCLSEELMGG